MAFIILFNLSFAGIAIKNSLNYKKIKNKIYISSFERVVMGLSLVIFLLLGLYQGSLGFLFSLLVGYLSLISNLLFQGLGDGGFYLSRSRGLLVEKIDLKSIDKIKIYNEKTHYFTLSVYSPRGVYYGKFPLDLKNEVEGLKRTL